MPKGITFEIKTSKHNGDYLKLKDLKRVEEISRNLEKDQLWGWCIPEVRATYEVYTGIAQLANGSYFSEEDFKASPDYEYLKKSAIEDILWSLEVRKRVFEREVKKYDEGCRET